MSDKKISCREFDAILSDRDLVVVGSCHDMGGSYHPEPQIDITWGLADGTEVLRSRRYPPLEDSESREDRTPCEHWIVGDPR